MVNRRLLICSLTLALAGCESANSDGEDAQQSDVDAGDVAACPERHPACESPRTLATELVRGVVGVGLYETDARSNRCEPECTAQAIEVFLAPTAALVEDAAGALRTIEEARDLQPSAFDGAFEVAVEEGTYLLCAQSPNRGSEPLLCAGVEFGADTVYTAVIQFQFGPTSLFVTRNSDGLALATFEVVQD